MEERKPVAARVGRLFGKQINSQYMEKMFSSYSNQQFGKELVGDDLLNRAVEYIRDNLNPDEVYDVLDLEEWAVNNGFKKEE